MAKKMLKRKLDFFTVTSNTNKSVLVEQEDFQSSGPSKLKKKKPSTNKQHSEIPMAISRKTVLL